MARTNRAAVASGQGVTSLVTGSFTPTADSLLVVHVAGTKDTNGAPSLTVSGGSLTYAQRALGQITGNWTYGTAGAFAARASIHTAQVGSSPSSMTVTATFGATVQSIAIVVEEHTGHDSADPVGATDSGSSEARSGALSDTLSGSPASDSYVTAVIALDNDVPSTSHLATGTGWTQIGSDLFPGDYAEIHAQYRTGSTSSSYGWDTAFTDYSAAWAAIEIKAAGGSLQALTSTNISATPTLGAPVLTLAKPLTAAEIDAVATIANPSIALIRALQAVGVEAPPSLDAPVLAQIAALTAPAVSATPSIPAPTLALTVALSAPNLEANATAPAPVLTLAASLAAASVSAGATIPAPALSLAAALAADDVSVTLEAPTPVLASPKALDAPGVDVDATAPTPTISIARGLVALSVDASAAIAAPALTLAAALSASGVSATGSIAAPSLALIKPLSAASVSLAAALGAPTLSLAALVEPADGRLIILGTETLQIDLGDEVRLITLGAEVRSITLGDEIRLITLGANGMADEGRWDKKDPQEAKFYSIDWTSPLDGDPISSATWSAPAAITIANQSISGYVTTAKLSGGEAGTDYEITVTVVTDGGQTFERSPKLKVRTL